LLDRAVYRPAVAAWRRRRSPVARPHRLSTNRRRLSPGPPTPVARPPTP